LRPYSRDDRKDGHIEKRKGGELPALEAKGEEISCEVLEWLRISPGLCG
jgi:hypothetical protein